MLELVDRRRRPAAAKRDGLGQLTIDVIMLRLAMKDPETAKAIKVIAIQALRDVLQRHAS